MRPLKSQIPQKQAWIKRAFQTLSFPFKGFQSLFIISGTVWNREQLYRLKLILWSKRQLLLQKVKISWIITKFESKILCFFKIWVQKLCFFKIWVQKLCLICADISPDLDHNIIDHVIMNIGLILAMYWCFLQSHSFCLLQMMDWSAVDYCDVFIRLSFWRHPFTDTDAMLHSSKSHLHLG